MVLFRYHLDIEVNMGKRMTISLSPAFENDVDYIIKSGKYNVYTKIDVIRNGLIFYKMMIDEFEKGNRICIANKDNKILKEVVIGH